jgi:hypothetical protein
MQAWKQALNARVLSYPANPIDRLVAMADRVLSSQSSAPTSIEMISPNANQTVARGPQ